MKKVLLLFFAIACILSKHFAQLYSKATCTTMTGDFFLKGVDTTKDGRGMANNYFTWENGETILVKFMPGGSKLVRDRIRQYAKEWETHANIKFQFVPDNTATTDIRVQAGEGLGHNSYIGIDCHNVGQTKQTLNLDTLDFVNFDYYVNLMKVRGMAITWDNLKLLVRQGPVQWDYKNMRGTVLHEFGHALGLLHEQSYPGAILWNKDTVYKYYEETNGWDKERVDFNVFNVSDAFYTNGTRYDPQSIMHYPIESWQTINGYSVGNNHDLSVGDKQIIAALYPKVGRPMREVPKVDITNFTKLEVFRNPAKMGLSIYPAFDLKTNARLGQVWVVARLVDENERYILDNNDYYNWGGYVATYKKLLLLPNSRMRYNKELMKDLELFIPYSEIPLGQDKTVTIEFRIMLEDVVNEKLIEVLWYYHNVPVSLAR